MKNKLTAIKKPFIVFLICIVGHLMSFGQEKQQSNTLLWRISGKGLTRPSYLYGTMHLPDKKIFQLGDSLYKALENTEGFAGELDMNSMGTRMINYFIQEKEQKKAVEPVLVKEVLDQDTWDMYKGLLEKKLGKKADKITIDDLDEVESRLNADLFRKGDMPTFLDAWLSGQARKLGKWIGGIEDFEDQLEQMESIEEKIQLAIFDDSYYRQGIDRLKRNYIAQRLDSIDALMYREEGGAKDYIMIKRNLKMSRRIDSLASVRSTLFAIGAGHLPGDSGVISLLRSRGFTVTPVFSSKTLSADKYVAKEMAAQWYQVPVSDSLYNLFMPGQAESFEMFASMGLDMKMFFDLSFMRLYMTASLELPAERKALGTDSLYKAISARYAEQGKVLSDKRIEVKGIEGREYKMSSEDGELRLQIFLPKMESVVLNAVFGFSEKGLNDAESERFFQSFSYNSRKSSPAGNAGRTWTLLEFPEQSFSVQMPLKPKASKDVVSAEGKILYTWEIMDLKEQVFYGMSVSAMKDGMYDSGVDADYYDAMKESLLNNLESSSVVDSADIVVDGYPGFRFSVSGLSQGQKIITEVLIVPRGGLSYYVFSVYAPGSVGQGSGKKFLGSFRLLPYKNAGWKTVTSPDNSFTTTSPYEIIIKENEEEDNHPSARRFAVFDTIARVNSYIDRTILPDWLWYKSDTAFLRTRADAYYLETDSILEYKAEENGPVKSVSLSVMKKGDNLVKKVKLLLNGNELYEMYGHYALQDMNPGYNRFYDEFKLAAVKPRDDRSHSGSQYLKKFLTEAGDEDIKMVKSFWNELDFTEADVPALREMMLKIYPDFDSSYYSNLNKKIYDQLQYIDSNHTSVSFFREKYKTITSRDEYAKPLIIAYLTEAQTKEAFEIIRECMNDHPIRIEKNLPYFYTAFYDSLQLSAMLFPGLMKEAAKPALWDLVCRLTTVLLDSNLLDKGMIKSNAAYFLTTAKRVLAEEKQSIEEDSYQYSSLIRLLGVIGGPEAGKQLIQFAKFNSRHIKFRTLIAMLESNMSPDSKVIYTMATTDEYRHDLYDELKRLNKLKLFPSSYLSQKLLGQSKLYEYATDEDPPGTIEVIGEKTLEYKGKKQKFYLYKVGFSYDDDIEFYLGVAGPYSMDPHDYKSSHDVTGLYWKEAFDSKKINEHFEDYLKSLEEKDEEE